MTRQGLVDVCDGCDIGFKAMLEGSGSDSEGELGHAQIGQGSHAHLGQISHPHFGQSNHGHVNHSNAVMPFADNAITAESMDEYGGGRDAPEALPTCASRRAIARARQSSRQSAEAHKIVNCGICGNRHKGECWYRSKAAYGAMTNDRIGRCGGTSGKRGRNGSFKLKCYNCHRRGHIARDCPLAKSSSDDDDSELDEATLRKAAKQL